MRLKKYFEQAAEHDLPDAHCILGNNLVKKCKGLSDQADKKDVMDTSRRIL